MNELITAIKNGDEKRLVERDGFQALRRDKRLRALMRAYHLDEETRFYAHKGVTAFNSDWMSVTEGAALWRIERYGRQL